MEKDGTDFVWEDLRTIPHDELINHFPNIIEHCSQAGYDVFHECIPIVPAQHYFMGGIMVNHNSKTSRIISTQSVKPHAMESMVKTDLQATPF